MPKHEYEEYTKQLTGTMGLKFTVTVGFYVGEVMYNTIWDKLSRDVSIESYEMEGDNLSRDELVNEYFDEAQVKQLEEDIYEMYTGRLARGSEETTAG